MRVEYYNCLRVANLLINGVKLSVSNKNFIRKLFVYKRMERTYDHSLSSYGTMENAIFKNCLF